MKPTGILSFMAVLPAIAYCSSQDRSSPRDRRKTKSPGTLGCPSAELVEETRFSPSVKRKKGVKISDKISYHELDEQKYEDNNSDSDSHIEAKDNIHIGSYFSSRSQGFLTINANAKMFESTNAIPSPRTPISSISASITKATLQDYDSPQSVAVNFDTRKVEEEGKENSNFVPPLRPILKKLLTRKVLATINLFRSGTVEDLKVFYAQGTQLPMSGSHTNDLLTFLFQAEGQIEKLKLIYDHDRQLLLNFIILKASEVTKYSLLSFASTIFGTEIVNELEQLDVLQLRVAIYLHAITFKIEYVYKLFTELIDDEFDEESREIAKVLLESYYRSPLSEPLLTYAARTDGKETFLSILGFDSGELDRLDSKGCSVVYHAAFEGNLEILEILKSVMAGKSLLGTSPLIAIAIKNRDDSLEFFLNDDPKLSIFSEAEIEEAAFTSAQYGNFRILKMLMTTERLNLYCHRGSVTFLSAALQANQLGFATLLVDRLKYNVNFVGEDPVNPDGHALCYLLTKHDTAEFFLKRGANRNILVPPPGQSENTMIIHLSKYLEICNDPKLIKLFNKYP